MSASLNKSNLGIPNDTFPQRSRLGFGGDTAEFLPQRRRRKSLVVMGDVFDDEKKREGCHLKCRIITTSSVRRGYSVSLDHYSGLRQDPSTGADMCVTVSDVRALAPPLVPTRTKTLARGYHATTDVPRPNACSRFRSSPKSPEPAGHGCCLPCDDAVWRGPYATHRSSSATDTAADDAESPRCT